jgi:hypothetical protein
VPQATVSPSGDQSGFWSPVSLLLSATSPVPSVFMTKISSSAPPAAATRTNATRPPDGLRATSYSVEPVVATARGFEPSEFMSQTSPFRMKAIVEPSFDRTGSRSIAALFVRRSTSPPPKSIE